MKNLSQGERKERNKVLLPPMIAVVLAGLFLLSCFFTPLLTATGEYREYLLEKQDGDEAFGDILTNGQAVDISMQEYFKIHWDVYAENSTEEAIISTCIFCGTSIISLIILLFALLRKPVAVMVFDAIAVVPYLLSISYISGKTNLFNIYEWSGTRNFYYVAYALILLGAVWMLINKVVFNRKIKAVKELPIEKEEN